MVGDSVLNRSCRLLRYFLQYNRNWRTSLQIGWLVTARKSASGGGKKSERTSCKFLCYSPWVMRSD